MSRENEVFLAVYCAYCNGALPVSQDSEGDVYVQWEHECTDNTLGVKRTITKGNV